MNGAGATDVVDYFGPMVARWPEFVRLVASTIEIGAQITLWPTTHRALESKTTGGGATNAMVCFGLEAKTRAELVQLKANTTEVGAGTTQYFITHRVQELKTIGAGATSAAAYSGRGEIQLQERARLVGRMIVGKAVTIRSNTSLIRDPKV